MLCFALKCHLLGYCSGILKTAGKLSKRLEGKEEASCGKSRLYARNSKQGKKEDADSTCKQNERG